MDRRYKADEEFLKEAARLFERNHTRYSTTIVTVLYDMLSVGGQFGRQELIRIAEGILELEGFVMVRAATRRSLMKELARYLGRYIKR